MARRIRGCFDHPFRIGDLKVSVDCALGCAIQGPGESDIADQIRHAQIALKRAKQTDRIEIYEPEAAIVSDNRFGLETALRSEEHTCTPVTNAPLVCRLLLEKKKTTQLVTYRNIESQK